MSSGVGIPSHTAMSYGTECNTLFLFDLDLILKLFPAFSHTCIKFISFLLDGQVNLLYFNTITQ